MTTPASRVHEVGVVPKRGRHFTGPFAFDATLAEPSRRSPLPMPSHQ